MNTIEITVTILFLVGGIALTATIIIYPKDIIKGVFTGIPMAFLQSLWNRIWFLLIPFWGPVWLLDKYFKWDIFERFQKSSDADDRYTGTKRKIKFSNFKKFILTTEIDK